MLRSIAVLAVIACAAPIVLSGPLDPPVGPIAPTAKPLAEIEPRIAINATNTPGDADSLFKISQPGSYYLTGNLTGVAAKNGIEIAASNVSIDLGGFELRGVPGAISAIRTGAGLLYNINISNGTVVAWEGSATEGDGAIWVVCRGGVFSNLHAITNDAGGMLAGTGCVVTGCTAIDNAGPGISVLDNASISNCAARGNDGRGFTAGIGYTMLNCIAAANTSDGILGGSGGALTHCISRFNDGSGIIVGAGSVISGCAANSNDISGIIADDASTIARCSTYGNKASAGISVGQGSSVADCTSGSNTGDGIVASSVCTIRGNTCDANGVGGGTGAGINLTGSLNRVEGNVCTGADFGIFVNGIRNFMVRNTCGGNITNFQVLTGNYLLVINPSTTTAVTGDSGGATIGGTTDANANFSY